MFHHPLTEPSSPFSFVIAVPTMTARLFSLQATPISTTASLTRCICVSTASLVYPVKAHSGKRRIEEVQVGDVIKERIFERFKGREEVTCI